LTIHRVQRGGNDDGHRSGVVGEKLADAITSVTAAGFKVATVSQTATGTPIT